MSGRLNYVGAFTLSALLVLLIGLGICALLLSNTGGMHWGNPAPGHLSFEK